MKSVLALALATGALGSAALASQAQTGQTPAGQTPAAPTLKAGDDPEKMKAFVAANCTGCHEISVLGAAPHEAGEWDVILQRMAGYHPPLAEADLKALQAYLVKTYPAKVN